MVSAKNDIWIFRHALLILVCSLVLYRSAWAQDPQFSQFYAAPLYLSPAFAGSTGQARAGINYRNQWPSIAVNFTTISAYFDLYIEDINSGAGLLISRDQEGLLGFQSLQFALQYSYNLKLTPWLHMRAGIQGEFYYRNINFNALTFGDQFDPVTGKIINPTSAEPLSGQGSMFFPSVSAGLLLYTSKTWLGVSARHLTEPNQSTTGKVSKLPIHVSVHGGYKIALKSSVRKIGFYTRPLERSITPVLQYRHQGSFDLIDIGLYTTLEPIIVGVWYRGIPFKPINNFSNNESIVLLFGFVKKWVKSYINIGYSYDITISKLGVQSGGAHEVSMSYSWSVRNPRKPPKDKLIIPCPDF